MAVAAVGAMSLAEASLADMLSRCVAFQSFVNATGSSVEKIAYALTRIYIGATNAPADEDAFSAAENDRFPCAIIATSQFAMVHMSNAQSNEYTASGEIRVQFIRFDDPLVSSSDNYVKNTNDWHDIWSQVWAFTGPENSGSGLNITAVRLSEYCQTKISDLAGLGRQNPDFQHKIEARAESTWSVEWNNGEP